MRNFWIALFDASGNPKGNFVTYMGHEADFDTTDGLIALGPLKAEHITRPNIVEAIVDGRDVGLAMDIEFAVGDEFRRISDGEFAEIFGEESYRAQLAEIRESDARLEKLADWQPSAAFDAANLPDVEITAISDGQLRAEITELLAIHCVNTTFEAVVLIDRKHPGFAAGWCASINPEHAPMLRTYAVQTLMLLGDDLDDLCRDIGKNRRDGHLRQLAISTFARFRGMLELSKHLPVPADTSDGYLDELCGELERNVSEAVSSP